MDKKHRMNKKRTIYNSVTETYYDVREISTDHGNKGEIVGSRQLKRKNANKKQ